MYSLETSHNDPPQTTQSREIDFSLIGSTIEDTYATIPKSLAISNTNTAPDTNNVRNDNIQCIQGESICSSTGNTSAETYEDGGAGEMNCTPLKISGNSMNTPSATDEIDYVENLSDNQHNKSIPVRDTLQPLNSIVTDDKGLSEPSILVTHDQEAEHSHSYASIPSSIGDPKNDPLLEAIADLQSNLW